MCTHPCLFFSLTVFLTRWPRAFSLRREMRCCHWQWTRDSFAHFNAYFSSVFTSFYVIHTSKYHLLMFMYTNLCNSLTKIRMKTTENTITITSHACPQQTTTLYLTSTRACYEESRGSYPTRSWCTTLLRETGPDAQALFHPCVNLARALTAVLAARERSGDRFKWHDLRFHVPSLARRWWEASSPPNIPPLQSLPSSLFPSLSLSPRFFRLVQPAWHSSQSAKTRLPGELGTPPSDRGAWSTPQASSDRIRSVPLDQSARHVTRSQFVARSSGTMWRQSGGQICCFTTLRSKQHLCMTGSVFTVLIWHWHALLLIILFTDNGDEGNFPFIFQTQKICVPPLSLSPWPRDSFI